MVVLLAILKVLVVCVVLVAALVMVALLLPLGFSVKYHKGRLRIEALYGPLRRTVWSHKLHMPTFHFEPKAAEPPVAAQSADLPPQQPLREKTESSPPTQNVASSKGADAVSVELPSPGAEPPRQSVPEEEEEVESSALMQRLERIIELTAENPKAMANCILGHMRWLQKHSFFKIHVRRLNVFWTVTCEDASKTAVVFGAEMALLNTILVLAQQTVPLQSERLWLEPDFTGTLRSKRQFSCTVSARAILMFHLLYRIWKDPMLQPASQSEPQIT